MSYTTCNEDSTVIIKPKKCPIYKYIHLKLGIAFSSNY